MTTSLRKAFFMLPLAVALAGGALCGAQPSGTAHYFVDCGAASSGDGRSADAPWTTLEQVNQHIFHAGDVLALRRGAECRGTLWPKGSGVEAAPIRLTAYGSGARPRIKAAEEAESAFRLFNQEYWEIDSLDIAGGREFGVFISGDKGVLHHIHLANLTVHDVAGAEMKHKESGLVVISPGSVEQHFDDVLVDGVAAYNTRQWAGILVGGGNFGFPPESTWSTRVTVRNSVVHDVEGDGIVLFRVRDGRIASSVAWKTGMQTTESMGTPNAIWTWMCHDCTVENNEAFLTDSPGVDGGAFDIDYGNTNNAVIGNYGHDTQGYCVAIFAAGFVTRQSVVRGNTCIENGRSPRMARFQGAIFIHTWNDGKLDGVTVEDNHIWWSPPGMQPAVINDGAFTGGQAVFRNNHIESLSPWMVASNGSLQFDKDQYRLHMRGGGGAARWVYGERTFNGWEAFRGRSGQEAAGTFATGQEEAADSLLTGRPVPEGLLPRLPAKRIPKLEPLDGHAGAKPDHAGSWRLYALLPAVGEQGFDAESRGELTLLSSLEAQFRASGLVVTVGICAGGNRDVAALRNAIADALLDAADFALFQPGAKACPQQPRTLLMAPQGRVVGSWRSTPPTIDIGVAVRRALGKPIYAQLSLAPH